jgi:hypothetical protein
MRLQDVFVWTPLLALLSYWLISDLAENGLDVTLVFI